MKILFVFPVLFLFSCSIQKRQFNKGYTIHWKSHYTINSSGNKVSESAVYDPCDNIKNTEGNELVATLERIDIKNRNVVTCDNSNSKKHDAKTADISIINCVSGELFGNTMFEYLENDGEENPQEFKGSQEKILTNLECDTIILVNGNTIICNILEVRQKKIIYHLCCPGCSERREIKIKQIDKIIRSKISHERLPKYNNKALISFWLVPTMMILGLINMLFIYWALLDSAPFFMLLAFLVLLAIIIGCSISIAQGLQAIKEIESTGQNNQKGSELARLGIAGSVIGSIISALLAWGMLTLLF